MSAKDKENQKPPEQQPPQTPPPPEQQAQRPPSPPIGQARLQRLSEKADGKVSEDDPGRPGFVRRPFGATAMRLATPPRAGYHRHWFNDTLDRIEQAKAAGYSHVSDGRGKAMMRVVGSAREGGPQRAFLMEIPVKWFLEDMAAGQKIADEIDAAIGGGSVNTKEGDARYVPTDGIAIEADA